MADKSHIATDKKLAEMEKRLSAIYRRAEKELGESWKKYLSESTKEIDELQKAYDKAKQGGDKAEIKKTGVALSRAKKKHTVQNKWYKERTEQLARDIANVNKTALSYINGQLPEVYSLNYNAIAPDVEGVGGYSFSLVDADTVRNLSLSDEGLLPTKELVASKDVRWNVRKMNAEVLQGILQGETMDEIAGRMSKVFRMNENSAITNARTMVTGAENKGRMDSYTRAEADGIILDKQWIATKDSRTRHSHVLVDREIKPTNEEFSNGLMYPGDPNGEPSLIYNCRCTVVSIVKGFKKKQVEKAMEEIQPSSSIGKRTRRGSVEDFMRSKSVSETPDFENMSRIELSRYVSENISAKFGDVSGVTLDFYRKTVEAVKRVESIYGEINGLKIEFGGANRNAYADFDPRTKILHLKKKGSLSQFADSIARVDEKTMRKYGVKYNAESSYEGTVFHELAHAIDHDVGWNLSKSLGATNDILIKSRSISFYARDRGSPNLPRATEATAENLAAYFMGDTSKIEPDVLEIIEEFFKKRGKK